MDWQPAPDIHQRITQLISKLDFTYIHPSQIVCFRSYGSTGNARARIWGLPRVWQLALSLPPTYIIEVISEKFDHNSRDDQDRILIHELMHIPKNFSGALVAHRTGKRKSFRHYHDLVESLFRSLKDR